MVTKIKLKNRKILIYTSIGVLVLVLAVLIPLGFSEGTDSATTYFDNSKSSAGGQYLKDAIDEMNYYCSKNCPSGKICKSNTPKCIRATTLHTETCSNTDTSQYCQAAGYALNATITYGNTSTTSGVLTTGDAFDCDVNGDGTFDATTERFYYVSDYYDTSTKFFNDKVAVLIYYSNVKGGVSNTSGTAYDCTNKNYNGPVTLREQLPTTTQWSNIRLYKDTRQILSCNNATSTYGGTLPTAFSYVGYAARFLTYQEAYHGCNSYDVSPIGLKGLESKCQFLMEGTKFSNSSLATYGPWLESPGSGSNDASHVKADYQVLMDNDDYSVSFDTYNGARPTIEILKSEISY